MVKKTSKLITTKNKKKQQKEKEVRETIIIPRLRDFLGYDISLMKREVYVKYGRQEYPADLVFYNVIDNIKRPFLVVETKAPDEKLDWIQAESYAQRLGSPFFVVTDGSIWNWYRTGKEGQGTSISEKTEIHPPKMIGEGKLAKFEDISEAMQVIRSCHDVIWNEKSSTPDKALEELTKFLIAKIIDEKELSQGEKNNPDFAIKKSNEDPLDIKNRINELLIKALNLDPDIFPNSKQSPPTITLKPYSVIKIVEKLQIYTITHTDKVEILGESYQALLKETYSEKIKGQRFTPRNVVEFMIELVKPKLSETIFDPACGTGGFLVSALRYVKREIDDAFNRGDLHDTVKKLRDYSENNLYGTDIEESVVALAKANMILHGDGHSNIILHDGLIDSEKTKKIKKIVMEDKGFDIIVTNPPFGGIKIDPEILTHYTLAKNTTSELTQVLFIERCTKLLKNGGRLAIVLPDGVLSNPKLKKINEYLKENYIIKALVSLPKGTFSPYGADPKTHIFIAKKKEFPNEKQKEIINIKVNNIGYSVSGKAEKEKDLPIILEKLRARGGIDW